MQLASCSLFAVPILQGDAETVQRLLAAGFGPQTADGDGRTPLLYAAAVGNVPIARLLLDAGANVHHSDTSGSTAMRLALDNGHTEVAELLQEQGAQPAGAAAGAPTVTTLLTEAADPPPPPPPPPPAPTSPMASARRGEAVKGQRSPTNMSSHMEFDLLMTEVFRLVDVARTGSMSVLHELPVALAMLGFQWNRHLAVAFLQLGMKGLQSYPVSELEEAAILEVHRRSKTGSPHTLAGNTGLALDRLITRSEFSSICSLLQSTGRIYVPTPSLMARLDRFRGELQKLVHAAGTPYRGPGVPGSPMSWSAVGDAPAIPAAEPAVTSSSDSDGDSAAALTVDVHDLGVDSTASSATTSGNVTPSVANGTAATTAAATAAAFTRTLTLDTTCIAPSPLESPSRPGQQPVLALSPVSTQVVSTPRAAGSAEGVAAGGIPMPQRSPTGNAAHHSLRKRSERTIDSTGRSSSSAYGVFLGGACNPSTWRADIAIPMLTRAGVSFYNPQVDEWHPGLVAIEAQAKATAKILLFVVGNETRGIASMVEAAEFIAAKRRIVLVVQDMGPQMGTTTLAADELKDLNRGRTYLRDTALRNNIQTFETVQGAVQYVVQTLQAEKVLF